MQGYIGRFAPSPSGPLHLGSLVAAVGSYLQAKTNQGKWLVRMEDLDPPREEPGATEKILYCLEAHGLYWDDEVSYQRQRYDIYQSVVDQLISQGFAYRCFCSRKQLSKQAQTGKFGLIYPGNCRHTLNKADHQFSIRVKTHDQLIEFNDARMGFYSQRLESELGDFIIKRSDGFFAYQLAVVVDDALQEITEVVRGEDLLDNTPRQIHLQTILDYPVPGYLHLPLVKNQHGQKFSKQTHAPALNNKLAAENLVAALHHLGIELPSDCKAASTEAILSQAAESWKEAATDFNKTTG